MTVKADLRAAMRGRRKQAAAALPDAAEGAAGHADDMLDAVFVAAEGAGRQPLIVALYKAIGSELSADPLARVLAARDVPLALPVAVRRDAPLIFRRWTPGDPLEPDASGCPAPLELAAEVRPDLIVTPLLAFDRTGGRLGQGGGYYDRTFAALADIARVGLAYAAQELDDLPMDPHDQRLHGVLTEAGYRTARISH